jgi:hypothetical protein
MCEKFVFVECKFICARLLLFSDFHRKQDTIKALKRKALDKNPLEFYFHMVNSKIEVCNSLIALLRKVILS